jgi:hypothetical protein
MDLCDQTGRGARLSRPFEVDQWEQAHFKEDEIRSKVKAAKKQYEDALREKFCKF